MGMGNTPKLSRVGKKGGALHGGGSLKFWGFEKIFIGMSETFKSLENVFRVFLGLF